MFTLLFQQGINLLCSRLEVTPVLYVLVQCQFIFQSFCYAFGFSHYDQDDPSGVFHTCATLVRHPFFLISPHVICPIFSGCQRPFSQFFLYGVLSEFSLLCYHTILHNPTLGQMGKKEDRKEIIIVWIPTHKPTHTFHTTRVPLLRDSF